MVNSYWKRYGLKKVKRLFYDLYSIPHAIHLFLFLIVGLYRICLDCSKSSV